MYKNIDKSAYYMEVLELVCRVCRQVAGKQYSLWEDFLLHGRHKGQEEMTLEELLKHIKVKAHTLSTSRTPNASDITHTIDTQ